MVSMGQQHDVTSYNCLINGYCKLGKAKKAMELFREMIPNGIQPDVITYNTLLSGLHCGTVGDAHKLLKEKADDCQPNWGSALQLYEERATKTGDPSVTCKPDLVTYSNLNDGLCKHDLIKKDNELFSEIKSRGISQDVACTTLIPGFCSAGKCDEVMSLFNEMVDHDVHPNVVTFNMIMTVLCNEGKVKEAKAMLKLMIQSGINPDTFIYTTLMDGLCSIGRVNDARKLFISMVSMGQQHDVACYNCLINGYCKFGRDEEAVKLFREMILNRIQPNVVTYTTLLNGFIQRGMGGDAQKANDLFLEMEENGCTPDSIMFDTLLRSSFPFKNMPKVVSLLQKMVERSVA